MTLCAITPDVSFLPWTVFTRLELSCQSSLKWLLTSRQQSYQHEKMFALQKRCLTDLPVLQVNWQKGIEDTVRREGEGLYFHEKKTDKKSCLSGVNTIHLVCSYHFRLYYESFHCPHCLLHRNIVGEILLKKNKSFITRWTRHYFHLGIRWNVWMVCLIEYRGESKIRLQTFWLSNPSSFAFISLSQ